MSVNRDNTYACDQCGASMRSSQLLQIRETPDGDRLCICEACELHGLPSPGYMAETLRGYISHILVVVECIGPDAPEAAVTAAVTERMKSLRYMSHRQQEVLELAVKAYYLLGQYHSLERQRVTKDDSVGGVIPIRSVAASEPRAKRKRARSSLA